MTNVGERAFVPPFIVSNAAGDPVAGIAAGAFTKVLALNGVAASEVVTIAARADIGVGWYDGYFDPLSAGHYELLVTHGTYGLATLETFEVEPAAFVDHFAALSKTNH